MTERQDKPEPKAIVTGIEPAELEAILKAAKKTGFSVESLIASGKFDWSIESLAVKGSFFVVEHLKTFRNDHRPEIGLRVPSYTFTRLVRPVSATWTGDRIGRRNSIEFTPEELGIEVRPRAEVGLGELDRKLLPDKITSEQMKAVGTDSFLDFYNRYQAEELDSRFIFRVGEENLLTAFSGAIKAVRGE